MKVRCIDAGNSAFLKVGNVYSVLAERNGFWDLIGDNGWVINFSPSQFEPVHDEPEAPAEQPKVDPYEEHRMAYPDERALAEDMATRGRTYGATARLLRGLEGEKVRERVRPFPVAGRNFELRGKR